MKKLLALSALLLTVGFVNARHCGTCKQKAPKATCVKLVKKECPAKKVCQTACHLECPEGTRPA